MKLFKSPLFISIVLFGLAFVPRLLNPDQFLTADEFLWVDRSKNFLAGLTNPAYRCTTVVETWAFAEGLDCTLRTGHPGVTTMWSGSFGLWLAWLAEGRSQSLHDFVAGVATNPLDPGLIAVSRFATFVITAAWVVAMFWLLRRLLGFRIAVIAGLLLALDPFHLALSRVIHHDALSTTFMSLSALTALIYWGEGSRDRRWLLGSGVLGGLAFMSKSPALFLLPFVAVVGLWFAVVDTRRPPPSADSQPALLPRLLRRTLPDGLLWFALFAVTVVLIWPAMWVIPLTALDVIFTIGTKYATGGHAKGNYFLGQISNDPGPLFYPVTWLFRTTPLTLLGTVSALVAWPLLLRRRRMQPKTDAPRRAAADPPSPLSPEQAAFVRYLPLLLLFIVGFYLLMTFGEKKQDRYLLPVYPWFNIIAAGGLLFLVDAVAAGRQRLRLLGAGVVAGAIVLLNGYFIINHYPYYFTYYNPLLGGPTQAAKTMTVGWGEGLDLAAEYFNTRVNPTTTRIASWYQSTFAPFYYGPAISYSEEKGKTLAGDFVIFYINQLQRRFPDDILFEYFMSRSPPHQVINLHGIDYVWIYPSLGVDHYVTDQTYSGIASLLAWQWGAGDNTLTPASAVGFELYWEYLGKAADEPFFIRLLDAQGRVWAEGRSHLLPDNNPPPEAWREGEILLEQGFLDLPLGMPPGDYQVQIGFYTNAPAVTAGELTFLLRPGDEQVTVQSNPPPSFTFPAGFSSVRRPLNNSLELLGAGLPATDVASGETLPLELLWRVTWPLPNDAALHVGLMDENNEVQQAWFNLSLAETFNPGTTLWQSGEIIETRWQLELQPDLPPGDYRLELVDPNNTDQVLSVGTLTIE